MQKLQIYKFVHCSGGLRRRLLVLGGCCLFGAFALSGPARAQGDATAADPAAVPEAKPLRSPAIDLVPGEDGGSIRFIIDGKPVGWLDAKGLHVVGNIEYSGTITDAGSASLNAKIDEMGGYHE